MTKYRCMSPMCNTLVDFVHGQPAIYKTERQHIYFCSAMCRDDWSCVNNLLTHAAEGKPVYQRRPTRPRHWYEKDG